ncbi:MAG: hypothetical protein J6U20_10135 [Fibrobacter sp.]|nr:hypothetical protein [Fibrobacter sp.]
MDEKILAEISEQLTVAYMSAGKKITGENVAVVAKSITDSIGFASVEEVRESFRRAKMVQDIPTQRTLAEALANHRAETYSQTSSLPLIENRDPRSAWLPKDQMARNVNMRVAIRNLCAAISEREYSEFCKCHLTRKKRRGDKDVVVLANPKAAHAFDRPKKAMLEDLYKKYWRMLPIARGYPKDAPLNHGLIPPTVPQFRVMLEHEAKVNGYTAA